MIENDLKEIIMNKIFFAKYLPIEGEIKKDDNALNPSNKKVVRVNAACLKNLVTPEWKKVKLFLCSRDISIGDKVRRPSGFSERPDLEFTVNSIGERDGKKLYKEGDENYHTKGTEENTYKVIGEISPDAIWVTEGMEFDDDELLKTIIYKCREPENNIPLHVEPLEGCIVNNTFIKIKCPTCKQFH